MMFAWQTYFGSEEDRRRTELDTRLQSFYSCVDNYEAFQDANWKPEFWAPVRSAIETYSEQRRCKVLEIGAGKTAFTKYLGHVLRNRLEFHVQDITERNRAYLNTVADKVYCCDVTAIRESYDIIFSTFVYEHMTQPRATVGHLLALLRAGGSIFIASPRYDFPGYLSPSVRHLSRATQLAIALQLLLRRLRALLGGSPLFLLHFDPAAFHGPWFRDADAVHWPSLWDLRRELAGRADIRKLPIRARGLRGRCWARFLLLFVRITHVPSTCACVE